ncbi:MAG: tetratricopeptide repeat protein, partial [Patescibacteria group bacterium]
WGPENYIVVFNKYYNPLLYDQEQWFDRSHNVVFDWLINAGALGLLVYLSLFILAIYYLMKGRRERIFKTHEQAIIIGLLAAYFIHNFFVFDQLVSHLMFFGLLAYLHTHVETDWTNSIFKKLTGSASRWLAISGSTIAIIGLIFVFYFINLRPIFASHSLIRALSQQNYPAEGLKYFEKVFAYDTFGSTEATEQLISITQPLMAKTEVPTALKQQYVNLAVKKLEAEINSAPNNARYYFFAGVFYSQLGQKDLAIERLEKARELSPKKQTILFTLANAYLQKGVADKATTILREAYDLAPAFSQARDYLINIYAETKKFDQLVILWQEKITTEPNNPNYHGALGLAYFYNHENTKAIAEFKKVAGLDPKYKPEA